MAESDFNFDCWEPAITTVIGEQSCLKVSWIFNDNRHVFKVQEDLACWIYEEFRSMLGVHDRNMFLPWYSDIAKMMLRHELSDNPDKLYLIRSQADEWAIRVARRIMYRKITHFDLNAEHLLSEWKHLLRWARAVWECESNDKNEWFKIKMETK